jgi:hypothetical protein
VELSASAHPPPMSRVPADQLRYATLLEWSTRIGFVVIVAGFSAYMFRLLPGTVPIESLPSLWTLPASAFLDKAGTGAGWNWARRVATGEFASLLGIAVLAGSSVVCLAALIPGYLRHRDHVYAVICALSIAVVLLAASGALTTGH